MTPTSTSGSTAVYRGRSRQSVQGLRSAALRCRLLRCSLTRPCARMRVPKAGRARVGVEENPMPLSEDEQRILQEIEAQFYANDPQLAQQVSETTLYRHASRNIKWSALGFVVGFVVLLTS